MNRLKMRGRACVLCLWLLATGSCWAGEPLLTFVCAGQSNMVGKRCKPAELPARLRGPSEVALFFDPKTKSWIPLEAGKTQAQGFGPEIAFGAKMAELLEQPVGVIKLSQGGTNLAKQWDPDSDESPFAELRKIVDAARESREIRIAGMLWVQGGADAKSEEMASAYERNLRRLVESSREDFESPDLVFLSGRIPEKSSKTKPFWKLVRAAQQNLEFECYAWVNCDDISLGPDGVHYDTAGMVQLGERQADLMAGQLRKSD